MLADCCISDTTSLIAEFCLLDKPIVTFRVPATGRTLPDVIDLIERISVRIDTFDELNPAVKKILDSSDERAAARREAVGLFFDNPDGRAGERAAAIIAGYLPELKP